MSAVSEGVWETVTVDDQIIAAPTLLQSYMVFANTRPARGRRRRGPDRRHLDLGRLPGRRRRRPPRATSTASAGAQVDPTATVMSLGARTSTARSSRATGEDATIDVGDAELAVPERIHDMTYDDRSLDPVTLTQSGADVLPGFLAGELRDDRAGQLRRASSSPSRRPTASTGWCCRRSRADPPTQAANPQTLSVSAQSAEHVEEAAEFIEFYMQAENLAAVAEGDWLIPASAAAADAVAERHRRRERLGHDPRPAATTSPRRRSRGRRLPAVEGPDRHPGAPAVLRRPDRPRRPASSADRRLDRSAG